MNRKNLMIKEFQAHARRLNENLDYDSKVLYDQVRALASRLTDEELAKAIQKGLSQ